MQKVIKIDEVKHNFDRAKKDGGTYNCSLFAYYDNGKRWENATATKFLETNPDLKAQLNALEIGQEYVLTTEKNAAGFWNIESIVPNDGTVVAETKAPQAKTAAFSTAPKKSYVDNSIGMQVGNALTNAVSLIASGQSTGLEATAIEILKLGESLKIRLEAGEFKAGATSPKKAAVARPVAKVAEVVIDEDIPFGS